MAVGPILKLTWSVLAQPGEQNIKLFSDQVLFKSFTLGCSTAPVFPLVDEWDGNGGGFTPRSSFLSAKSLRPRFDAFLDLPLSFECGEDSHSLELDEPEEARVRPWDFVGGAELLFLVAGRILDGDLEREREEELQSLPYQM